MPRPITESTALPKTPRGFVQRVWVIVCTDNEVSRWHPPGDRQFSRHIARPISAEEILRVENVVWRRSPNPRWRCEVFITRRLDDCQRRWLGDPLVEGGIWVGAGTADRRLPTCAKVSITCCHPCVFSYQQRRHGAIDSRVASQLTSSRWSGSNRRINLTREKSHQNVGALVTVTLGPIADWQLLAEGLSKRHSRVRTN